MEEYKFPENFLWGSATSSYQVEGRIENNDWAQAAQAGTVPAAGIATDHYNRYEEDFDIAKSLGQNAHRFSIEWARIEPEEGRFNEIEIEHYKKVIDALRNRGMEPFVTLWHFTLPLWFSKMGGFTNSKASFYFSRYTEYVVSRLGDRVKFWITINEPLIYARKSFLAKNKSWPPFKNNIFRFFKVIKTLIASHIMSHNVIKKLNSAHQVGIAKNNIYFENYPFIKYFWNSLFTIKNSLDFIGLNYYFHRRFPRTKGKNLTDMGWEIYPKGIYHVLKYLKKYKKPIYITENGLADEQDKKREKFIKGHLLWVHKAIQEGVDLRGYFYWSLLDNFEWAHGFDPRFGLVEVDYQTLQRKIRPSAYEYAKICKNNKLVY